MQRRDAIAHARAPSDAPAPTPQTLGLDAIQKRHWRIVACSAFTGAGLVEGVDWVVQDIASRIFMYD